MKKIGPFSLFIFLVLAPLFVLFPPFSGMNVFHGCSPKGSLISIDDRQVNELKNRINIPAGYEEMTVDTLLKLPVPPASLAKKYRYRWPPEDLAQVQAQEKRAVRVEGYIVDINRGPMESCNCYIYNDRDFHIWLASSPGDHKSNAVITEATPRVRINHPGWTLEALNKLVERHVKLRISGWIMLDAECPECVGKKRGTLWEIHPIFKIEFQEAEGWKQL